MVSLSPGYPPAFSILDDLVQLIWQHPYVLCVGCTVRQMWGPGATAGWSPEQRAPLYLLTGMGKGVGSTSHCSKM